MKGKAGKKRKKKEEDESSIGEAGSDTDNESINQKDKYTPFLIPEYTRVYPEDGGAFQYIVFFESTETEKPIGDRDMMSLSNSLSRYNKGIKQLQRINRYKIGAIFERPGLANQALTNKKFLDTHKLKATIPAAATETTGVIQHVPLDFSNEQIYHNITSTKNVVSIRRFMRRTKTDDGNIKFEPTKTVSITFSCPVLPDSVDLNKWRFEVRPYIPPVKQCLRCLRYGHIAKYCKNQERCSVCSQNHNYKVCDINFKEASCCHCGGNHIAISNACPVKKQKIEENKKKLENKLSYAELLQKEKSFPPLKTSPSDQFASLLNSDQILSLIVESFVKIFTDSKNSQNHKINTENIKSVLLETLNNKNRKTPN